MSATSSRAGRRPGFRPVVDRFELSRHVQIARTWSQTGSQLICDLLATWIAPDRTISITLSNSLAAGRPARELVRELDSVMEFGLYGVFYRRPGVSMWLFRLTTAVLVTDRSPANVVVSSYTARWTTPNDCIGYARSVSVKCTIDTFIYTVQRNNS